MFCTYRTLCIDIILQLAEIYVEKAANLMCRWHFGHTEVFFGRRRLCHRRDSAPLYHIGPLRNGEIIGSFWMQDCHLNLLDWSL